MDATSLAKNDTVVQVMEMTVRRPSVDSVARARAGGARTPSPTPSEREALAPPRTLKERLRHPTRREFYLLAVILIAVVIITIMAKFHNQIAYALQPPAQWMRHHRGGWAIPVALLIIMSFPPLAGHELVATMCGLAWGIGLGFLIVCLGTWLGELALFVACKHLLKKRGERYERKNIQFATLAAVIREGRFKIILMARLSAIPPHFTTAVLATCGTSMPKFLLATFLALPRQFAPVYIGYALEQSIEGDSGAENSTRTAVSVVVASILAAVTVFALRYIRQLMAAKLPTIVYERRKRRQAEAIKTRPTEQVGAEGVSETESVYVENSASKITEGESA